MAEVTTFAHGYHYGDYSGVIFYGPPTNGFWVDRLAVSDCYISPLFHAVLDRAWRESGGESVPRVASEWNTLTGWANLGAGVVPLQSVDAEDIARAFTTVSESDLAQHVTGSTIEECLACAWTIQEFICARLTESSIVYIESD
ncbi:hypothetical protein J8F10_35740 [Gemmata sp. G18]|uniref:Uncharacterized protein n=1 Tax=Gemmata palustris TaxID=2822762 RepID=A0ABS5C3R4_9BACT|nr:hypothetical protein [Gemmata palustris]MBP3960607.1 hypothetical protein [Gemmata palustris]